MASPIHNTLFPDPQLVPSDTEDPFSLGTLTSGPEGTEHNESTAQSIFGQPYPQAQSAEVAGISNNSNNYDAPNNTIQSILEDHWANKYLGDNDLPSATCNANHDLVTKNSGRDWDGTTGNYFSEHFVRDSIPHYQLDRLAVPGFENYDLRLAPRLGGPGPSCYLDQDQTDDFDPKKPDIIDAVPLKRKRESLYEEGYGPRPRITPRGPSRITYQHGRNVGKSLIVKLKFTTICGREIFPTYEKSPASQSGSPSNEGNSDQDSGLSSASHTSSETSPSTHEQYTERRLRKAAMPPAMPQETDDDDEDVKTLKLEDLTLGHPAARGCKPCFELGLECDLLTEGSSYPCAICDKDDVDCELVLPPEKKRGCEGCRKNKIKCSYRYEGSDHSKACDHCFNLGHNCVAGPFSGRMRTGPALGQKISLSVQSAKTKPAPATQHESFTGPISEKSKVARVNRTSASAIHKNRENSVVERGQGADEPLESATSTAGTKKIERKRFIDAMLHPVSRPDAAVPSKSSSATTTLRQQKINEILTPIPRQQHNAPIKLFPRPSFKPPKKQQQIKTVGGIMAPLPKISTHGYTVTNPYSLPTPPSTTKPPPFAPLPAKPFTITTRLAHPIQLNFLPPPPSLPLLSSSTTAPTPIPPCHFHPPTIYPLLGLPPLTPVVCATPSSGYTELHGGHTHAGFPASRMCPACTSERVRVIECGRHEMEELGVGERYVGVVGGWMENLGRGEEGKGEGGWRLCTVCVGVAGWGCARGGGEGGGGGGGGGCGLSLCERCAVRLVREFEGRLEGLVEAMVRENEGGMGFGVRADVEMVLKRGEVGRRLPTM